MGTKRMGTVGRGSILVPVQLSIVDTLSLYKSQRLVTVHIYRDV